jgi:SAM-dependent methyltransferase
MNEGVDFEGGTPVFVPSSHTWSDIYDVPCTYWQAKALHRKFIYWPHIEVLYTSIYGLNDIDATSSVYDF